MRVAFSDPDGPRVWRGLPYAGPLALLLFGCVWPFEGEMTLFVALLAFALAGVVSIVPFRQRKMRPADLLTGPGFVEIKNAKTRSQKIAARSIAGGTTARTKTGILFTLQHADRDQPIAIEVASADDAERIRHALGIGHGGFGMVGWRTTVATSFKIGFWGRVMLMSMAALIAGVGILAGDEAAASVAGAFPQFAFFAFILCIAGWVGRPAMESVMMTAAGLRITTRQGIFTLPYDHVLGIEREDGVLRFHVPPPYHYVDVELTGGLYGKGLSTDESDALIEQIMSAAARARGLGATKDDVTGRVEVLRRNGEPAREWLARLDMAGRMLDATTAGYRGHTLNAGDLWAVLEDPDADADLRAASARVLRHSSKPETRQRIDAAVAAVRDEGTNQRLRIAICDDVDDASQELARLDVDRPVLRAMQPR